MALPWCMFHVMSATFFGPPSGPDEFPQESLAQRVCNLDKSFLGSWVLLRVEEVWDTWILYIYILYQWLENDYHNKPLYFKDPYKNNQYNARWWQLKYFLCSLLFWEDEPILTIIFLKWVETTNKILYIYI